MFELRDQIEFKPFYQMRFDLTDYVDFIRTAFRKELQEIAQLPFEPELGERYWDNGLKRHFIVVRYRKLQLQGYYQYIGINHFGRQAVELCHFAADEELRLLKFNHPSRVEGLMNFKDLNRYLDWKSSFESVDEILKNVILAAEVHLKNAQAVRNGCTMEL